MPKFNKIILIDDNESTNFLNQDLIEELNLFEYIISFTHSEEALEYISNTGNKNQPKADFVLLDLNMPEMTGWEFIETFRNLEEEQKAGTQFIILTSSSNPADTLKSGLYPEIAAIIQKPLEIQLLREIISSI